MMQKHLRVAVALLKNPPAQPATGLARRRALSCWLPAWFAPALCGLLAVLVLSASLAAKNNNKKAEKLFQDGQAAELKQNWDVALDLYQKAVDIDGANESYIIAMRRARFQTGQKHVNQGQKLRNDGKYVEAMQEFQKAIVADPASAIAMQELKRTQQMLEQPGARNNDEKGMTPSEVARHQEDQRVSSMLAP